MPGKLGLPEILIILAIALLIFGPSKLADSGQRPGRRYQEFQGVGKRWRGSGKGKEGLTSIVNLLAITLPALLGMLFPLLTGS